jgi:hypothetical protein
MQYPARTQRMLFAATVMLAACSAPARKPEPPPPAPPPLDSSYDYHVLLVAPMGTLLKDVPLKLHEVLLFRDDAPRPAGEDPECYAPDTAAPRFIARAPDDYLLCFKHDRLSRLEATLRLPNSEATQIFADACGLWIKNSQTHGGLNCEGTDGGIAFTARLDSDPDETESQLTVQLEALEAAQDRSADR